MIKGVNRQIIEVSDTGSAYFERALLIVRANCADADTAMLHDEAGRAGAVGGSLRRVAAQPPPRFWRTLWAGLGGGAAGAVAGALLALALR